MRNMSFLISVIYYKIAEIFYVNVHNKVLMKENGRSFENKDDIFQDSFLGA